jgi:hypothetical protein
MLRMPPPYKVALELMRGDWPDVLSGSNDQLLFSQRAVDILKLDSMRGVEIAGKALVVQVTRRGKRLPPPEYWFCSIRHGPTAIDLRRSRPFPPGCTPTCNVCLRSKCKWDSLAIDEATWDGADLFEARGLPGKKICTTRFRGLWSEAGLKGAVLLSLDEYVALERARRR